MRKCNSKFFCNHFLKCVTSCFYAAIRAIGEWMVDVLCDSFEHQDFVVRQIEFDACDALGSSQRTIEMNFPLCRELALAFFPDLKGEPVAKKFDTNFL